MAYKKMTYKTLQAKIANGGYKSATGALRGIGKVKLSKRDKEKLKKEAMKIPTSSSSDAMNALMLKLRKCSFKNYDIAKAAIRKSGTSEKVKHSLYATAQLYYKKKPKKSDYANIAEAVNSPNFLIEFTRITRDKKRTKELLHVLNGAAEFGLTLPQLLEALEAA